MMSDNSRDARQVERTIEYQTLREEILSSQRMQFYALGFVFAFVAAVMQNAYKTSGTAEIARQWCLYECLALLGVAVGVVMAIGLTQNIDRLAAYIKTFIEKEAEGLQWETRLRFLRQPKTRCQKVLSTMLSGMSKRLAIVYFFLAGGITLSALLQRYANQYGDNGINIWPLLVISGLAAFLCTSLFRKAFLPGFNKEWDVPTENVSTPQA